MMITPDGRWVLPVIPASAARQLSASLVAGSSVLTANGVTPVGYVWELVDLLNAGAHAHDETVRRSDGSDDTPSRVPTKVPMISPVPQSLHADWITVEATRERLGAVSPSYVTRLARDGALVAVKVRGRWKFDPASVEERSRAGRRCHG